MTNYTMISPDFKDFPRTGRLLGIDWGARRIGLAVSDENQEFVFVRPQIENKSGSAASEITKIANDERVFGIVIGLPIRSDGTESETTKMVRDFANQLSKSINLPIIFVDESLSSFQAEENLVGIRNKKQKLDSESARVILENAIALLRRNNN